MKIVNCALLYADGDKYVWSVVTEDASKFPIDMTLVADGSIWENNGTKSVLTDGVWVAESSGGGMAIPEITIADPSGGGEKGTYTSTVPFNEMVDAIANSPFSKNGERVYPLWVITPGAVGGEFMTAKRGETTSGYDISFAIDGGFYVILYEDGTCEVRNK